MAASDRSGLDPAPDRPRGTVAAPAASTVRFVLLIAAVVATSGFIFLSIDTSVPSHARRVTEATARCTAANPAFAAPIVTAEDAQRALEALRRLQTCMVPTLLERVVFVLEGMGVLFGLALVSYLLHPWWIRRRRRLTRLSARHSSRLRDELEQLRCDMGVYRSPDWRLAPFARTTGGQAFGLPWHRYVQIDAGLAVLSVTDGPAFRAVVRHELAHLRNRDVDKTYLTIAVWRAFTVVALLPYLVLILHPGLFRAPFDWHWHDVVFVADPGSGTYRIGSLLLLVALVYLTRNAILRVRETHADATAAAMEGPGGALPAVLGRLPGPPWWRRWGTHPSPRQRLETVNDPRLTLQAGLWELVGVGIAAGLVCTNAGFLVGINFLADPRLAFAAVGLVTSSLAAGLLAVAIWRTTARDPARSPSARTWLAYPAVLVAGFEVGTFLTLQDASTASGGARSVSPGSWMISTLVLCAGAVFLAAWIASATHGVLTLPERPRWVMPAVVAVAGYVGAVWFAVWLPASLVEAGFADGWGPPPAAGAEIGWYARVAAVTGAAFGPMARLVHNPLTLPGLTLMWLVPVLAVLRHRPCSTRLRQALVTGAAGAGGVALVGTGLPFAARAALPVDVRGASDGEGALFHTVYENTTLAVAALAVAVTMAVVVARRGPHRPSFALLAGSVAAVLSTFVLTFGTEPIACYTNIWETVPAPTRCFGTAPLAALSQQAHWIILQGIVVAVPGTLLAAAAGAVRRRRRPPPASEPQPPPSGPAPEHPTVTTARSRATTAVAVVALSLLITVNVWFSVLTLSMAYQVWLKLLLG